MAFNSSKNPPWARPNDFGGQPNLQPQMMNPNVMAFSQPNISNPQQTQVYQAQIAMQQQALSMQQFVNSTQSIYNPAVSGLPQAGGRQMPIMPGGGVMNPQISSNLPRDGGDSSSKQQRVFTGTVTKVMDSYGFVDDDVFFQMTCVKGPHPILHDRVLVEAVCLPSMPFKWNATRVQVLPMNENIGSRKRALSPRKEERNSYSAVPPPNDFENRRDRDRERDRERERERDRDRKSPDAEERRRRRERREKEDKGREREKESRARTRSRSRSPRRSRTSPAKKYRVRIPEHPLDLRNFTVSVLKSRYSSMYIPGDFFSSSTGWNEMQRPFDLAGPTRFHVIDKELDRVFPCDDLVEPPDADFLFSAKVMLLSIPPESELLMRCVQMAGEKETGRRTHAARLIDCLVGVNTRNKNEYMAIGGPWSPSLDGADPLNDPNVLIKTATRCCRALTGIDLSGVTKWYRYAELHYHRAKSTYKGRDIPARVETVVIYTPDVWSILPSALEWDGIHLNYQRTLDKRLAEIGVDESEPSDEKEPESPVEVKEPTHWSKIDFKTIKVAELRDELEARHLSPKGLRLQMIARLSKIVKQEQETEEEAAAKSKKEESKEDRRKEKSKEEEKKSKEKEEPKEKEVKDKTKERASVTEKLKLPETPHLIVHPCRKAKGGKFNCKVVCLSLLLDYNQDINKEHTFEVSFFAENFNEMIMRDFGLQIYQALSSIPEKTEEKKKEDEVKDEQMEIKIEEVETDIKAEAVDTDEVKTENEVEIKKEEEELKETETEAQAQNEEEPKKDVEVKRENADTKPAKKESDGKSKSAEKPTSNGKLDEDEEKRRKKRAEEKDKDRDKKKKEKVALTTVNPLLLLAFSYFDTTLYGKISASDLEDLLQTLGLYLSRAQIKRLVSKLPPSDSYLDYRKLTDAPEKPEVEETDGKPEICIAEAISGTAGSLPAEIGNKAHMPVFAIPIGNGSELASPPAKRLKTSGSQDAKEEVSEGVVMFNGTLVNVANLQAQLAMNEEARLKAEEKTLEMKHDLENLNEKLQQNQKGLKDVRKELETSQKRLSMTSGRLERELVSSDLYLTTLMDIQERIMPILDTDEHSRLCLLRQQVLGAPQINLVPLTKLEDLSVMDDVEMEDVQPEPQAKDKRDAKKD